MRIALVFVVACAPFVEPAAAPPPPPPPPPAIVAPPPTTIVQNNFTFVTEPPAAPAPSPPPPRAPRTVASPVDLCRCYATATLPPDRESLASTTVASCDRYLRTTELAIRCQAPSDNATVDRVIETLDLARRQWRTAAVTAAGRDSLVDSCTVADHQMTSAMARACP